MATYVVDFHAVLYEADAEQNQELYVQLEALAESLGASDFSGLHTFLP